MRGGAPSHIHVVSRRWGLEKKLFLVFSEMEINEIRMLAQDRDEREAYLYVKNVLLKKVEDALRKSCRH